MEIDFLIRKGGKITPVEVKSGDHKSIKSITKFMDSFGNRIGKGIILHHGEIKKEDNMLWLPYYTASVI